MMIAATIASAMQMMIKYNLFKFFISQSCLIAISYNKPYALFDMLRSSFFSLLQCSNEKKNNYVIIT